MAAAAEFRNFPLLPPEIRNMVWEYAMPDPRVYEIMDKPFARKKMDATDGLMFTNVHHEPPPALAAVCTESRAFVLHHYRPLNLGRTTKYVDLSRDLLLLEPYLLLQRLHRTLHFMSRIPLIRDNMAGLALGTSYGVYPGICHPLLSWKVAKSNIAKLLTVLAKFAKLKTLLFVVHQEFQFEFDFFSTQSASAVTAQQSLPLPPPLPPTMQPYFPQGPPLAQPVPATVQHPGQVQPDTHHAMYLAPPAAVAQAHLRPQIVHQAYRFKFDIEGNINSKDHIRHPHLNELRFYPLDNSKDGESTSMGAKDEWDSLLNSSSHAANGNGDDEEDGDWCDPWPTNDDWRRFRRRFQRAVVAAVQAGLVNNGSGAGVGSSSIDDKRSQQAQQQKCGYSGGYDSYSHDYSFQGPHQFSTQNGLHSNGKHSGNGNGYGYNKSAGGNGKAAAGQQQRQPLQHNLPAIKGASLLWRYTRQ